MRYRATLAYVGTFFHGWQVQENAPRTVQAVVESALGRVLGAPVRVHGSGRTDAGVHADGQVAHFDGPPLPPAGIVAAVNVRLPWDVRALDLGVVSDDFHARSSASGKRYVYRFSRERVIPPRQALFRAPLSARADAGLMAAAASRLVGVRDFFPFSTAGTETESTVRELFGCEVLEAGPEIEIRMTANGFLRGMARAIAGTLADAGRGRIGPERIDAIFAGNDKTLVSAKAKPRGLTLEKVFYPGDPGASAAAPVSPSPAVRYGS
ncbi:MAG TPA: tRNA pseudouridine(38-40) synthase TruA [Thermoanaerobaculia bacterium]|nr:tRNA pseudouridine(38-40) synthase TruA [Thermoanaerobaculia bacterium]